MPQEDVVRCQPSLLVAVSGKPPKPGLAHPTSRTDTVGMPGVGQRCTDMSVFIKNPDCSMPIWV